MIDVVGKQFSYIVAFIIEILKYRNFEFLNFSFKYLIKKIWDASDVVVEFLLQAIFSRYAELSLRKLTALIHNIFPFFLEAEEIWTKIVSSTWIMKGENKFSRIEGN